MSMYIQSLLNMFIVHLQNASAMPSVGDLKVERLAVNKPPVNPRETGT